MGSCISCEPEETAPPEEVTRIHPPEVIAITRIVPPPASKRSIRQLPIVKVTPEDLVDECNRECCICLEPNSLHDKVMRLPCAHIFHSECISEWLAKSCTCPVCRYELQTDDPNYEKGRLERMKHRKPRYAQYELDRMKIRDLSALCTRLKLSTKSAVEKSDLIRAICNSGKVDMIVAPKPVEYKISDLRHMGVGSLKRAMGDAGVFFDAKDVLEKEDMVMIFVNSGRVALIAEDDVPVTSEEDISYGECETVHIQDNNPYDVNNNQQFDHTNPEESRNTDSSDLHSTNDESHEANDNLNNRSEFTARSITELRRLAYELQVDISDCIEKKEMIERLAAVAKSRRET